MKTIHLFTLTIAFSALSINLSAQVTTISRDWKFKTGDSIQWASGNYSDKHWDHLKTGLWWAHAGYNYSGFAWYRKKIFISSDLKPAVIKSGSLKFSLGQIQDVDQTFLNGELIGQTGNVKPFTGKWGDPRYYFVKADQILWDAENTIAVRVFGKSGNGGMHTGPYSYEPYQITFKDYIKITTHDLQEVKPMQCKFTLLFENYGQHESAGSIVFQVNDSAKKTINTQKINIKVRPGRDSLNTFTFFFDKPLSPIYGIKVSFKEAGSDGELEKEVTVSHIKNIMLPDLPMPGLVVDDIVKDVCTLTPFENIQLYGNLGERLGINLNKRLLKVDEKEILAGYMDRPGKQNWVGEHIGKYLETACNTWRYSHNAQLKSQMDRIITILLYTQKDNGYLGTYTPENYWTNWDVWSHKYNLIGLLAYYKTTGYGPALEAAKRVGNLLCKTFGNNSGQLDIAASGTHVGMASMSVLGPVTELYKYTGDQKYLDFAKYIISAYNHADGPRIIESLLEQGRVNKVANGKAYELLSNLTGILSLYKLTGENNLIEAVNTAWKDIVDSRLYITGTSSSFELFRDDDVLPAEAESHMGEGCVTTTWLQLNYQLFKLTGEFKFFDQIEKTIYNHLLGAENPQNGCVSYYTPLQDKKPYSCGLTCCLSSIPRGISWIPLMYYTKISGTPTFLLHESGTVKDIMRSNDNVEVPVDITIKSDFPEKGHIVYTIAPVKPAEFRINLRVPSWTNSFTATVDGEVKKGVPGSFLPVSRLWKPGDTMKVVFEVPAVCLTGGKSYPGFIAIKRGPQILSLEKTMNPFWNATTEGITEIRLQDLVGSPEILSPDWIGKQAYSTVISDKNNKISKLTFVPFSDASQTGDQAKVWIKKL